MKEIQPERNSSLYFRYCLWSNKLFATFALLLAAITSLLAQSTQGNVQQFMTICTRALRHFARTIVLPRYALLWMEQSTSLKALIDAITLCIPWIWSSYYLVRYTHIGTLLLWIGVMVFTVMCMLIACFPFVSGDVYNKTRDEFQKITADEASAFTLRIVSGLLILLVVCYPFAEMQQAIVFFCLTMLLFVARICYLFRLTQLRWQGLVNIENMEENDGHSVI